MQCFYYPTPLTTAEIKNQMLHLIFLNTTKKRQQNKPTVTKQPKQLDKENTKCTSMHNDRAHDKIKAFSHTDIEDAHCSRSLRGCIGRNIKFLTVNFQKREMPKENRFFFPKVHVHQVSNTPQAG